MTHNKHGFICNTDYTPDELVLALDKDIVTMMMNRLSFVDYHKWRLNILKKVLVDRVEMSDFSGESTMRINYTMRCREFSEKIIEDYNNS